MIHSVSVMSQMSGSYDVLRFALIFNVCWLLDRGVKNVVEGRKPTVSAINYLT